MPRKSKGARLYLRRRDGRASVWTIKDGDKEISTGCAQRDYSAAESELADYLKNKGDMPKTGGHLNKIAIADAINLYVRERTPKVENPDFILYTAAPVGEWAKNKTLADITPKACEDYLTWRLGQGVKLATARHDLKTLRAAINHYHRSEYGPLTAVPVVIVPEKPPGRMLYFWTRDMAAARLRSARRRKHYHVCRLILIGIYSGTRPGAIHALRWLPSPRDGWIDLDSNTLYRKGPQAKKTKKRAAPARIHDRLRPWLKRWHEADKAKGLTHVIHRNGGPVKKVPKSWHSCRKDCGHKRDGEHVMRHTCATWLMQAGVDPYEAAGYLSMSIQTLMDTYGHHHPDFQTAAAKATGKRTKTRITGAAPDKGERS